MKKSLVMALVLGLPVAAIAQQSAAPAPKPTAAKVETKKTESTEVKTESVEKKDGTKTTKKHHKKTTKKSTSTAPEAKPTPKS
jgi:cytoskeletal protein RodZ